MSSRLKNVIALWFVLQIVLPFTAPLQTLALCDLFPVAHHHGVPVSQESSATPTLKTASAMTLVSSLEASTLRVSTLLAVAPPLASQRPPGSAFEYVPLPRAQQTILRL